MTVQERSDYRLGELILFICQKSREDDSFGSIKLNKLLFYSDFLAYARWGETITGAEYWNLPEGPAPKRLVQVRQQLIDTESLAIQRREVAQGYIQKRPIQLRPPDLSIFQGNHLGLVEEVIYEHRNYTAKDITDKSHHEWGWLLTKEKETIEPSTILLCPDTERLSDEEIDRILANVPA